MRLALAAALALLPLAAHAQADLYAATAIVTGTDDRMRLEGFDRCLRQVLVKLTGDPALADDPRVAAFEPAAMELAEDFAYRDRMSDQLMHDEQGARDRPYDLTVHFSPARLAPVLRSLGAAPWPGPRPTLILRVAITGRDGTAYPLTADAAPDERVREAAMAAGERYAMRVAFVDAEGAAPDIPGAVEVQGTLAWTPSAFGWVGAWRLRGAARPEFGWGISGVSFDEAMRDAVRGAMARLR